MCFWRGKREGEAGGEDAWKPGTYICRHDYSLPFEKLKGPITKGDMP